MGTSIDVIEHNYTDKKYRISCRCIRGTKKEMGKTITNKK